MWLVNLIVVFIGILFDIFIPTYLIQFKSTRSPTVDHVNQLYNDQIHFLFYKYYA